MNAEGAQQIGRPARTLSLDGVEQSL